MSTSSVLITGVSSGIGHALAQRWLDAGWRVYGLARRTPDDLVAHPAMRFRAVDLADFEAIGPALMALIPPGTPLELVVLNAGMLGAIRDLEHTPLEDLQQLMDVNLWANKVLLDALWREGYLTTQVVAISSGAAVKGNRGWGGYALSKAALNMMMQLYAAERPDVHFSALAPGLVDTAMQEYIRGLPSGPEFASVERLKAAHGTDAMPDATAAAARLAEVIPRLRAQPSGAFADVRNL